MYYFVGLRRDGKSLDLQHKEKIEFYLYDYNKQLVEVKPYSEIEKEKILLWGDGSQMFEKHLPSRVLLMVEHDIYEYPYFNSENKCIENSGFLMVGEDLELGVAILTPAFELVYAPYTTLPQYLEPITEKGKDGKPVKNRSITFVQKFKSVRDFDLARLPLLFRDIYIQQTEQMQLELHQLYRKASLLPSANLYDALCNALREHITKDGPKPYCSIRYPRKNDTVLDADEVKQSIIPMNSNPYPCSGCMYICFPPMHMVATEQWSGNYQLSAIKFTRVSKISKGAFRDCYNLEFVEFPTACNFSIESKAFKHTALKKVVLPPTVTAVAKDAFLDCAELREIVVQYDKNTEKRAAKLAKHLQDAYIDKVVTLEEYTEKGTGATVPAVTEKPVFVGFVVDAPAYMVTDIMTYEEGTLVMKPYSSITECSNVAEEFDTKDFLANLNKLIDGAGIAGLPEDFPNFRMSEGTFCNYPVLVKNCDGVVVDNMTDSTVVITKGSETDSYIVMRGNAELDRLSADELKALGNVVGLPEQ